MMTRGEVALIVTDKGITLGIIDKSINFAVVPLIIVSSLITPILLKVLYSIWPDNKVRRKKDRESEQKEITYTGMYEDKDNTQAEGIANEAKNE